MGMAVRARGTAQVVDFGCLPCPRSAAIPPPVADSTAGSGCRLCRGGLCALNSEPLHAVPQGAGLQSQPDGGAVPSFDDPMNLPQDTEDVFALDRIEVAPGTRRERCARKRGLLDWPNGIVLLDAEKIGIDTENWRAAQNQGAFNDIFQLADIARPRILRQAT